MAPAGLWEDLRGRRVFITGGTGFFGCSLLEAVLGADRELGLGARLVILSRDEAAFTRRCPRLANDPAVSFLHGDIKTFDFPKTKFSFVIHLANGEDIAAGCRRALEMARACGTERFLLASSGAVYGPQPENVAYLPEDHPLRPGTPYAQGKLAAEELCSEFAAKWGLKTLISRGFAFCGPHLPLDGHFAVGNFIRDALAGGPIRIRGDGTPYRSYLHGADLALWLWTILLRGQSGRPYNVGSEKRISIVELASEVARMIKPDIEIVTAKKPVPGIPPEQYVPSTNRARSELGLVETVDLPESIRLTAREA